MSAARKQPVTTNGQQRREDGDHGREEDKKHVSVDEVGGCPAEGDFGVEEAEVEPVLVLVFVDVG